MNDLLLKGWLLSFWVGEKIVIDFSGSSMIILEQSFIFARNLFGKNGSDDRFKYQMKYVSSKLNVVV